ncbi:dynein regulatory complex subunit 3 isoform X6 [Macaca nemestrina]|uniref:dynein regulatory complex subunit 3 isoform X6 n=1 Tax=Macaca nemestrina TaxID=9545 RepID=UPI0005F4ED81|nr:dynein regulatory complex subunit 3 isoform X6 [Macaca nemestrina]
MNRLCDSMEPKVMDDDMLKLAVGEQGPQEEAGQLAKQEGILFKDVLSLQLDFRNLSFNNIETIEGLDTLVNLEDLSLFNNRISKIDSLDALVKLQVLSLGNNQIDNMMNIVYLRRFKCLRTLSLSGNPISEAEDYKMFICAYLPDLVYLDFRRIDDHTASVSLSVSQPSFTQAPVQHPCPHAGGCSVAEEAWQRRRGSEEPPVMMPLPFPGQKELAEAKHQYSIDELKHRENLMQVRLQDERARQEELEKHKVCFCLQTAFVEHLNGSFLFDSMYAEDSEGNKLSYLPGVSELLEAYKDKFVIICVNIFEYGLKQQEKRKIELDTFSECVHEAIQENQEQGKRKIAQFEEKHLSSLSAIREESELPNIEKMILECSADVSELFNELMMLEMQLVEQLEETINMFERNIVDMVGLFIENVQSLMAQCRDLENHHHEKLLEISISTLEKIVKGDLDEDLPDDLRALFVDKDTIVNAVGASHDIHLLKIDNREDELVTRINSWCTRLVDKIHKDEIMRNRKRVKEINQYIDHMQSELDNLEYSDILD